MKKKLCAAVSALVMLSMAGCGNSQLIDTTYRFDRAIVDLLNGQVIEGEVDSWLDFEDGTVQVEIGGKVYYTHSSNVVLIVNKE